MIMPPTSQNQFRRFEIYQKHIISSIIVRLLFILLYYQRGTILFFTNSYDKCVLSMTLAQE